MKNMEFASKGNDVVNADMLDSEIKLFETKLDEAQNDGDVEAVAFYSEKLELLKANQNDIHNTLGYSSDYYENEMARALEKGNDVAYKYAKKHWAEAKAEEETKKATNS